MPPFLWAVGILVLAAGILVGAVALRQVRDRPAPEPPPASGPFDAERAAAERLNQIELQERRAAATREADRELEQARAAQDLANREAARVKRAEAARAQEQAAAKVLETALLRDEVDRMRAAIETGTPTALMGAAARLDQIASDPKTSDEVRQGARRALRDDGDQRARCLDRTLSSARRLADAGRTQDAIDELESARVLGLDLPPAALEERARWEGRLRREADALAASAAEQEQAAAERRRLEEEAAAKRAALAAKEAAKAEERTRRRGEAVAALEKETLERVTRFYQNRLAEALRCKDCQGSANVDCERCTDGQESHESCAGQGSTRCTKCGTRGQILFAGAWARCPDCRGQGWNRCESCNGSGKVKCFRCEGSQREACRACYASGVGSDPVLAFYLELCKSAQKEVGEWGPLAREWPERCRALLGPSLAITGAKILSIDVQADRVVSTTEVTWPTQPATTSKHVLVWIRERRGDSLTVRGAQPCRAVPLLDE